MLRSSIETFCKGIFEDEEPKILTEKSLYAIFDLIMELDSIKQEPSKTCLLYTSDAADEL